MGKPTINGNFHSYVSHYQRVCYLQVAQDVFHRAEVAVLGPVIAREHCEHARLLDGLFHRKSHTNLIYSYIYIYLILQIIYIYIYLYMYEYYMLPSIDIS